MKFLALPALLLLLKSIQPIYSQCSLPAPTNLQSTMTAETAILKWKLSQSVAYYKVRYRKTGDAIWISSPQLNVSNYTISDLQPGTSYDLRVVPYCSNGQQGAYTFKLDTTIMPNIIILYLDDAPNGLTGATGAPDFVETPNIDLIAKNGMNFTNNSCLISLCAPSRAVMITGRAPARTGVKDNSTQQNFNLSLPTLSEQLQQAGIYTAVLGKFHDVFDAHNGNDWNYRYESVTTQGSATIKFSRNGGPAKKAGNDSVITKVLIDTAIALVHQTSQPLFLLISLRDPHTPTKVPVPFDHYYDNETISFGVNTLPYSNLYPSFLYELPNKNYKDATQMTEILKNQYRAMAYLDSRIGDLLNALSATGKLEHTLILFTSDNGFMNDEHGLYGKRHPYHESVNAPLHIWYNEWFPSGTSELLTSSIDLYATILRAAGITDTNSDGLSIKDLYDGNVMRTMEYSITGYTTEDNFQDMASSRTGWDADYKLIQYGCSQVTEAFFNLQNDPEELINLINKSSLQSVIQEYRESLNDLAAHFGDTLPGTLLNCHLVDNNRSDQALLQTDVLSIYPNPGNGRITLEGFENFLQVELRSVIGSHIAYLKESFDGSHLPDGMYLIHAISASGIAVTMPFIKQE